MSEISGYHNNSQRLQMIIKEYYVSLYVYKFDNRDAMDQFLERHTSPNFTEELDNMMRYMHNKKLNQQLINIQNIKHQAQISSLVHSIKYYRSNYTHSRQSPSENNAEGIFLNLFYQTSTALIP